MTTPAVTLVCGASGFIGSHACEALVSAGHDVAGISRNKPASLPRGVRAWAVGDLRDASFTADALRNLRPRSIVFAAGPADVQASVESPARDFAEQALPLVNVLDAARRLDRPPAVLLVSSAAVYGNPVALPVPESASAAPVSPYGFHKLMQETLLAEFHSLYGLPVSSARAFSTLGPGQRRLAAWDIACKAMRGITEFPGTGDETRDYLYVDDIANALATILSTAAFEGEVVNLASGHEVAIRDLAAGIFRGLGLRKQPRFTGVALQGSPMRWRADVTRLRALGFEPAVPFEDALARTLSWIRDHA